MDVVSKLLRAFLSSAFGSDELQSYSADYSWQANQMAHAMMGFFLAAAWYRLGVGVTSRWRWLPPLVPLAKAPFDVLVVWLLAAGSFPVSWREFFWDKATDLFFWWLGMYLAYLFFYLPRPRKRCWAVLAPVVAVGAFLFVTWTDQKKTFDRSHLPPGWLRVSQYDPRRVFGSGEDADKARGEMEAGVNKYLDYVRSDGRNPPVHLIIRGGRAIDRSDLAVALGTEYASRPRGVYYYTAARLIEDPASADDWRVQANLAPDATLLPGDLRYPHCLVIDDFVGTLPDPGEVVDDPLPVAPPADKRDGLYKLDQVKRVQYVFRTLRYRLHVQDQQTSTIWVLSCNKEEANAWQTIIKKWIATKGHELIVVDLGEHKPPVPGQAPRAGIP